MSSAPALPVRLNVVYTVVLAAALAAIQCLIGGTRLLFALPAYLLLALAGLLSLADLRRPKLPPDGWCLGASALFFGYVLARASASPVAYLAWEDGFMVGGALTVYLLAACYLTDPRRRFWTLGALLALAGVNLWVGARQFADGSGFMLFGFLRSPQYLGRASGLYICPDHLAGFLEVTGCLSLAAAVWSRVRPWIRLLFGYGALCCFGGLLLTASRGGLVSAAAGLLVLTALGLWRTGATRPGEFWRTALAVGVVAVALAGALAVAVPRSRMISDRVRGLADTQDIRLRLWPAALRQWELAPAWGTGAGTYLYYGRRFRDPSVQNDPVRPHNDYLELLSEYGAVGAGLCLLFLAAHARAGWRAFRRLSLQGAGGGSNAAAWNLGALAAVACLLAHSAVDFNLHIPANALLLAFVFGVLANPGRPVGEDAGAAAARFRAADLWPRLALPALGVFLLAAGAPRLPGEWYAEQARVALRDGRDAAALGLALHGLEHEQNNPYLYGYLGQARLRLAGDGPASPVADSFRAAAAEAYRAAVRLAPLDSDLLAHLGEAYTRLGDYTAADPVFRRALFYDPESNVVLTYAGFYFQRSGQPAEAEAAYRRGLRFPPYYPAAVQGLAETVRERAPAPSARP